MKPGSAGVAKSKDLKLSSTERGCIQPRSSAAPLEILRLRRGAALAQDDIAAGAAPVIRVCTSVFSYEQTCQSAASLPCLTHLLLKAIVLLVLIQKKLCQQGITLTTAKSLPKNAYVILGLLSFGEQSGYDLKQLADNSVGHFFGSPVRSQIYSELRRLSELGYASEREVEQDDRPDKRLYYINDKGLAALCTWLSTTVTSNDVIKGHLLLKIFFGRYLDRDELIAEVEGYRSAAYDFTELLKQTRANCGGESGTLFTYLTIGHGISHAHANIEWANEAIALLKNADTDYSWKSPESLTGTS